MIQDRRADFSSKVLFTQDRFTQRSVTILHCVAKFKIVRSAIVGRLAIDKKVTTTEKAKFLHHVCAALLTAEHYTACTDPSSVTANASP